MMNKFKDDAGYTLLELLVVLLILTFIATIAAPRVFEYLERAKVRTAAAQIEAVAAELDFFRLDVGRYPTEAEGLDALRIQPDGLMGWAGPYIKKESNLTDPWGNPFIYSQAGDATGFEIISLGSDGQVGGEGDAGDITSAE